MSTEDNSEVGANEVTSKAVEPALVPPSSVASKAVKVELPENDYPIDLPSPILLSASMILAIVGTANLFTLLTGGAATPLAIALVLIGLPSSIFFFYASIKKGEAETVEDDAKWKSSF